MRNKNLKRTEPRFGYPDLFRVVQYTLDHKRLIVQALGLSISISILFFFSWLGKDYTAATTFLPYFLNLLGYLAFYLVLLIFAGPVTWLIIQEIQNGERRTIRDAFKYGLRFGFRLATAPIGIISFLLAIGALLVIMTTTGLIPEAGPLIWAILFLPRFGAALLLIIGGLTLLAATLILPSIIVDGKASALGAFRRLARMMRKNFLTFWGYVFTSCFLSIIYFLFFSVIVVGSLRLLLFTSSTILAEEPGKILLAIPSFFHHLAPILGDILPIPAGTPVLDGIYGAAGTVWGISLMLVGVAWLSYPVLYLFNSGVIIYLSLSGNSKEKTEQG